MADTTGARELEIELCKEMFGDSPDSKILQHRVEKLIAYRDSYAAERERLARIDEREKCAERAVKWLLDGFAEEWLAEDALYTLRAAIKEDGK